MERSERTFVPEWLRSAGNITGAGSSAHHSALSSSQSDSVSQGNTLRIKSSKCSGNYDSQRSDFLESTPRRNLSSNGFARRPYSSFRSHRDKEKQNVHVDHWNTGSHPAAKILGRDQKDVLTRSHSMVSGKQNNVLPNRSSRSHINNNDVILGGTVVKSPESSFRKNFPSLGADEKLGGLDLGRVSSPGLNTTIQNLPSVNSSVIGGEGWCSVLAEVPSVNGTNGTGSVSVQTAGSTSVSVPPNTLSGLNMAEALAQGPSRAQSAPQLYDQTQRLEELALKQSRQLIPMTPSISKASGLNCVEKGKHKTLSKSGEVGVAAKNGQQQPSSSNVGSQSSRFKSDASNGAQVGKFLVLKPVWDNNSVGARDGSIPTNDSVNGAASPVATPSVGRISSKPRSSSMDRKPCSAQAQSRNDFFNLMRKKSSSAGENHRPPALAAPDSVSSPGAGEFVECVGNGEKEGRSDLSPNSAAAHLEEEEARFLRSLGWEEEACGGDDEGLTEEEINSFFEVYVKSKASARP